MPRNPPWEREELILALDLYFRIGLTSEQHPDVVELSHLLRRLGLHPSPADPDQFRSRNAVRMKLHNFAALDSTYPYVGLQSIAKLDIEIWDEFSNDRDRLKNEAQAYRAAALAGLLLPQKNAPRRYWAYLAKPSVYRIEDALEEVRFDWWPTKGRPIRVGDRVVIWRGRKSHRDSRRGVIALGEVVDGPEDRSDQDNPYWVTWLPDVPQTRVRIRYVLPPNLPLWLDGPADDALHTLTVSRGQGTIFNVTPGQWATIVKAAGGWPRESPEVELAEGLIDQLAGKPTRGQGFQSSAEARRVVEIHAMERATDYFEGQGWHVKDVSATSPYDLHCTQADGWELRVEVKGTTGDGSQVLLTAGEVRHARQYAPSVALFVLAGVELQDGPEYTPVAIGGQAEIYEPWAINDDDLSALSYSYRPSRR